MACRSTRRHRISAASREAGTAVTSSSNSVLVVLERQRDRKHDRLVDQVQTVKVTEQLKARLRVTDFAARLGFRASCGIALCDSTAVDFEAVRAYADRAMYRAKGAGCTRAR
jgi:GGDEF domain-containing protein